MGEGPGSTVRTVLELPSSQPWSRARGKLRQVSSALCSTWLRTKSRQVLPVCIAARQVLLRPKSNIPKRDILSGL